MSDPIVDRVDAMLRKRRSFVATPTDAAAAPVVVPAVDDDLPILTEVVDLSGVPGEPSTPLAPPPLQPILDALASDLTHALEDRIAVDLPEILENAMSRLQADLKREIASSIDSATRDFLARRQQLRLPFPADDRETST